MPGKGKYYEIDLFRYGAHKEMTVIGVDLQGLVISYRYYWDGQTFNIQQYNGLDAEALALQMTQESDPRWERSMFG